MSDSLSKKMKNATKWSVITEMAAKLVTPIVSMVLARLLTPDAFGVVATLTMVITFAELFTDAGFQKYLIQHEFKDEVDREQSTTVAFWSNLAMSLFFWMIIAIFNKPIAAMVGSPGLGHVLVISCLAIPLEAFSSIQMALFRRDFDYKTLFRVRMVSTCIPLIVTIPLSFWLRSYWALVIGTLTVNVVNAVLLTAYSSWKPRLFYSFDKLKEMLSFSIWSMFEAITIWLTNYVDVFIVGAVLSQYYLGLYRTSSAIVGHIMGLITSITTPILFSALSRLQNDEKEFQRLFFRFQKIVGLLVIPMGVGIFIFKDLVTEILLGSQWTEASGYVGLWGLTSTITIVLSYYCSEVYRAKGKPKLSVLAQVLHIVVLWPTILIAVKHGFETLYIARSFVRLELVIVNLFIVGIAIKLPVGKLFTNVIPTCIAASCMLIVYFFPSSDLLWVNLGYAAIGAIIYFCIIMFFPEERKILLNLPKQIRER